MTWSHTQDTVTHKTCSHMQDMQSHTRHAVIHKTCTTCKTCSHTQDMQPHARHAVTHMNMHNVLVACYRWNVWARHAVTHKTLTMYMLDATDGP